LKRSRVGSATPSPNANTSRVPSEGTKPISEPAASETAERTIAWSRSFAMRHREQRRALRDDGGVELGRTLRDEPRNTP